MEEGPGSGQLRDMMCAWVTSTAERVGVDTARIETIAVAPEETYGRAVNDLFPGSGYTDNAYLDVGKTETRIVDGGPELLAKPGSAPKIKAASTPIKVATICFL